MGVFVHRLVREVDYSASGAVIASNDPAAVDELFGYTARDFDTAVGLQYNRARWYDPNTGRWLSQDPIGFAAGDENLYRNVNNSPTNATDPSGLFEIGGLTPGQWGWAGGVLLYEWGANGYRAGRSLVTGEAGHNMGERAVQLSQNESGDSFDGNADDWGRFSMNMAQEITGANAIAEAAVGVDAAKYQTLDGWGRGSRMASDVGAMAGTAAGGLGLAGKCGVGIGQAKIPHTPNLPKFPLAVPNEIKQAIPIPQRLAEFYRRLQELGRATSAEEALARIRRIMEKVEDELSGIPRQDPPPRPGMPDGRMYPPMEDFVTRHADGSITAVTKGHRIEIGSDGSTRIINKNSGTAECEF